MELRIIFPPYDITHMSFILEMIESCAAFLRYRLSSNLQSEAQKPDLTESYNKPSCILFLSPFELCSFFFPFIHASIHVSMHLCLLHS